MASHDEPTQSHPSAGHENPFAVPGLLPAIEGYEFVRLLASGGQGVVFEAIQKSTKRKVAVKVLLEGPWAHRTASKRFEREIELVAQLRHPNIIVIFDSGRTADGHAYYIMDYIRGVPLDDYVREKSVPLNGVLETFALICEAVQHAHQRGIIHRDLKPSNILMNAEGQPRILDFGLAKQVAGPPDSFMTLTQQALGTLPYMSPEQARGNPDELDTRTDVYSLGVILYQLLTGCFPCSVEGPWPEVYKNITETPPIPPSQAWTRQLGVVDPSSGDRCPVDRDLETIILTALAKERARRYASAGAIADDIRRYLSGGPIHARRDQLSYLVGSSFRRALRKQPILFAGLVLLVSAFLGDCAAGPLERWAGIASWRLGPILGNFGLQPPRDRFQHVRVIRLRDKALLGPLIAKAALPPMDAEDPTALRRLHGRLMEKLAPAAPRAVAWQIQFGKPSEHDSGFLSGVRALKEAGTHVICATRGWPKNTADIPEISPSLLAEVRWGAMPGLFESNRPWQLGLITRREQADAWPSMALAAAASCMEQGSEPSYDLDMDKQLVTIRYWKAVPGVPSAREWLPRTHRVVLSYTSSAHSERGSFAQKQGDSVGSFFLDLPSDTVLENSCIDYGAVLNANDDELRTWFHGKVALVGDLSESKPQAAPGGRKIHPVFAHAVAIEMLLSQLSVRLPSEFQMLLSAVIGAALGLGVGVRFPHRTAQRLLAEAVVAVVLIAGCIVILRSLGFFVIPLGPILAAVIGAELAASVKRSTVASRAVSRT